MVQNAIIREKVAEIQAKGKSEREWWDKERASIQSKFMQELDGAKPGETSKGAASGGVNSDEDAVLVEGGGPSGSRPGSRGGTGKKKKSKK
jgi:translocation protein SEC66